MNVTTLYCLLHKVDLGLMKSSLSITCIKYTKIIDLLLCYTTVLHPFICYLIKVVLILVYYESRIVSKYILYTYNMSRLFLLVNILFQILFYAGLRIRNDLFRIRIFYFWIPDPDPTRVFKLIKIL